MNILQRLKDTPTGFRKAGRIGPIVDISEDVTGRIKNNCCTPCEEYALSLTVGVNYFANPAQKPHARKAAERHLLHVLYGDVLPIAAEIESAIFSGDYQTALEACSRLKSELGL